MMKKLTSLLLSAALMISLLACGAFAAKTESGVRIAGLKGPTTMGPVSYTHLDVYKRQAGGVRRHQVQPDRCAGPVRL